MDEILITARDLELEVNEDDIEELIMGHEDELIIEELQDAVRAMVLEWHPNQADVSRVGDIYNDNAINYFRKILKKREKQSTLGMSSTPHKQKMKRTD
ncbi:uncharacterized protein TNCV_4131771 [Trichonephila clavipes]|nr:uncharacterized protein TNCV_4131771 [Trichonephila clavipes]